jgi:mediator of RNA polymerase II transcription subunit 13
MESDAEQRATHFKRLAFHIYEQLRRTVAYKTRAKSLTDFGPAASEEKIPSKRVTIIHHVMSVTQHLLFCISCFFFNYKVMQLYTPAYVLSSQSDFRLKLSMDVDEQTNLNESILYCSYCLSDDQRYLLVSCTDDRGELLETCSINIEVSDR